LIYGLNGGVAVNTAQGYIIAMSYCSCLVSITRSASAKRFTNGLWLGFWMAFVVMNGVQYLSLYGGLLAALTGCAAFESCRPGIASGCSCIDGGCRIFFTLCGWRLATVLLGSWRSAGADDLLG